MGMAEWYVLRPLGPALFRWKGEFSPQFRGPRVLGLSEPFPLPSTIVGALAALAIASMGMDPAGVRDPLDVLGEGFDLWGPILRAGDGQRPVLAVHRYPGSIAILDEVDEEAIRAGVCKEVISCDHDRPLCVVSALEEGALLGRVGVELDVSGKTAIEGRLYEAAMFDARRFAEIARSGLKATGSGAGYVIRIEGGPGLTTPAIVRFGGEGGLAAVERIDGSGMEALVPREGDDGKFILASPAPLGEREFLELARGELELVGALRIAECMHSAHLGSIGAGYDMARNARRPVRPALMPGSILVGSAPGPRLGAVPGWGSLVRVPGRGGPR
jgi:hypothetical protein